ncbi:transposable element Tc1 transposase [Trichonephila clavipes]|nr:transposable element Tc1 transposase [Trichonephila clavipes]
MLGRRIAARQPPPTCLPELRRALLDEWCNIPQDQIDNLILSMPQVLFLKFAPGTKHDYERDMIIGTRLAGASVTRTANFVGVLRTPVSRVMATYTNLVSARNAVRRLKWCRDHLNGTQLQWEQVIWCDESSFTLFHATRRVFVWQTPAEAFHVDCVAPTVKHGLGSVMLWGAISPRGSQATIFETFSQIISSPYASNSLSERTSGILRGQCPCSQHPAVSKHGYMKNEVRAGFPILRTPSELETALHEEWV